MAGVEREAQRRARGISYPVSDSHLGDAAALASVRLFIELANERFSLQNLFEEANGLGCSWQIWLMLC